MFKKSISFCVVISVVLLVAQAQAKLSPREIYKRYAAGVVLVVASAKGSSTSSAGSGTIVTPDGHIITNAHVIYNNPAKQVFSVIHIFLKPERVTGDMNRDLTRHYSASVVAYDTKLDLALLKMEKPPKNLTVITMADDAQLLPGDEVLAIGHPEQGGLWTITKGIIGAEFQNFKGIAGKDVFQVDASLNRGNSGGLLCDWRGYQVGVNTAIARQGAGGVAVTGVNFAVKSTVVKAWVAKHNLALAYGSEPLIDKQDQVLLADSGQSQQRQAKPAPKPTDPVQKHKTLLEPSGKGSISIEDESQKGEEYISKRPASSQPTVAQRTVPKRKPVRFLKYYRLPPRPYTYKRLFSAVDKVRHRARDGFDDLEREIQRRR